MIASVLKTQFGMVMVFNKRRQQIPEYQGKYGKVKERILADAPPEAEFRHEGTDGKINPVPRENW